MVIIALGEAEQKSNIMNTPSLGVVSFYEADDTLLSEPSVTDYFENKAALIIKHNPWLCGRLIKSQCGDIRLFYNEVVLDTKDYIRVVQNDELFQAKTWTDICTQASPYIPKNGFRCIEKDEPLGIFTLFMSNDMQKIALVCSISHVIGDAFTLYRIWKMFDESEYVEKLSVKRDLGFSDYIKRYTNFSVSKPKLLSLMHHTVELPLRRWDRFLNSEKEHIHQFIYKIDQEFIDTIKAKYNTEDTHVSTNDVINSYFFGRKAFSEAHNVFMAINMRSNSDQIRIPELSDDMVGNYQIAGHFQGSDLQDPVSFRKKWTGILLKEDSISKQPTLKELLKSGGGSISVSTNWSSFYHQTELPGYKHLFHIPANIEKYESTIGQKLCNDCSILVFRLDNNELAISISIHGDIPDGYFNNCGILGRRVLS